MTPRFGALYPIYVRGLAYLAARQPAEAAGEFQRILDHRSIVLVDPMDALARLQLARALALTGDTVKAKSAYSDLLTLWKNADPDIPVPATHGRNTGDCRKRRGADRRMLTWGAAPQEQDSVLAVAGVRPCEEKCSFPRVAGQRRRCREF